MNRTAYVTYCLCAETRMSLIEAAPEMHMSLNEATRDAYSGFQFKFAGKSYGLGSLDSRTRCQWVMRSPTTAEPAV